MILKFFSTHPDHPLGDPKEFEQIISKFPLDNSFKTIDEVFYWFESLKRAENFRSDYFFNVVKKLDEVVIGHVRRLARDYLQSPRMSKSEEKRLWSLCYNYYEYLAVLYAQCIERTKQRGKDKKAEGIREQLPLVATRQVAARVAQLKLIAFRYGSSEPELWGSLGRTYLDAEAGGYAQTPVLLYPELTHSTNVTQQYLRALIFDASSMHSLMPAEIEIADRLITFSQSGFIFSENCSPESVYWVDAASNQPPARLVQQPEKVMQTLRFFSPGIAPQTLKNFKHRIERGREYGEMDFVADFLPKSILIAAKHLITYWAKEPPQREHRRHAVKTRILVLQGFDDSFTVFAGNLARLGKEQTAESWIVDNVSLGGFSASVENVADWLKIGSLLSIQPEGGENWLLGIVRRFSKDTDDKANVGIQALSRTAHSIELRKHAVDTLTNESIPGIWLRGDKESAQNETKVVLLPSGFDPREILEFSHKGQHYLLTPIALEESGIGFEIGRYRKQQIS